MPKLNKELKKSSQKPVIFGITASLILFLAYFLILGFANSFEHALQQFTIMWHWILLLVAGFGIQIGLFAYIKNYSTANMATKSAIAASGTVSTGSMIACCMHHLTDVLPFAGISAAALFLNKYQILFFVIGILSGLIGMNLMLGIIQKGHLYSKNNKILSKLLQLDMEKSLYFTGILSITVFFGTLFYLM